MKNLNWLYAKKTGIFCFGLSAFTSVIFLIVALIYDNIEHDVLFSICWLLVGFVVWLLLLLPIPYANNLLRQQTEALNVKFDEFQLKSIYPASLIFTSSDWLVFCGRFVFHREFIDSIAIRDRKYKTHHQYYCIIKCKNGKQYTKFADGISSARKVRDWFYHYDPTH